MTDTQEAVVMSLSIDDQRFGIPKKLLNNYIPNARFILLSSVVTIAIAVVVGAVCHSYTTFATVQNSILIRIVSLEANLEKKSEQSKRDTRAQITGAIDFLKAALEERFEKSEHNLIGHINEAIKSLEETLAENSVKSKQSTRSLISDSIKSLEARFKTFVEKNLDQKEQGSRAVIDEARKTLEARLKTFMVKKFKMLQGSAEYENCAQLYKSGKTISGVYTINPDGAGPDFEVFCDQKTAGGGWIVVQKRLDGTVDFHRNWSDYKNGFGNFDGEFWLGLDKIHRLTNSLNKFRVDLEDFDSNTAYAEYDMFLVANESKKYQLSVKKYSGTAGDSFTQHHGYPFSTVDQDNDSYDGNCAKELRGAWWYLACHSSNLNGYYHRGKHSSYADGVNWYHWKGYHYSARRAEMKIRPVKFKS